MAALHRVRLGARTSRTDIVLRGDASNGHSKSELKSELSETYNISLRTVDKDDVTIFHVVTLSTAEAAAFVAFYNRMESEKAKS